MSSGNALDIFALRDSIVDEYKQFATSFTDICDPDLRRQIDAIYNEEKYWPEPLLQINPNYFSAQSISELVASKDLDPRCAEIFQVNGTPLKLYLHQTQAIAEAAAGNSYVVTTGTGSGKSLCFFIPIIHRVLTEKRKDPAPRTRAIIIYPMNALANSQLEELKKFVGSVPGEAPITFGRYTGQESVEERRHLADNPPDILLTNFMMLELLLTRQEELDRQVIRNCHGLRFLVLDELHTYRGRQGADVALLVRRVRQRMEPENLQCIGTSATMASEGSLEEKNRVVADVAARLFSVPIGPQNIITETLSRITEDEGRPEDNVLRLGAAIDAGIAPTITDDELRTNALAVWVETRLGMTFSDVNLKWERARPMTMSEAVEQLAKDSGRDEDSCRNALRTLLLTSSIPETERTGNPTASARAFFAFKLHQFISGAGSAYATLEAAGTRSVTIDGQQFLPGDSKKRLYRMHFCRECGQEYHPVRLMNEGARTFLPRDIEDVPPPNEKNAGDTDPDTATEQYGFVTLHPSEDPEFSFENEDEDYPDAWIELDRKDKPRLKSYYRKFRAQEHFVQPDGSVGSGERVWFMPRPFRFCLRCKHTHTGASRDRNRLASLSPEGRSSATTVLASSALRWMHSEASSMASHTRKLLGFSDNRQDAALQAGHFNDFIFTSLIRAGFLGALQAAGPDGLQADQLGQAQVRALGFESSNIEVRREWLAEPALRGLHLQDAQSTLRQILTYRVWFDQRRGWRYTNPNLEQLGLVDVEYRGISDLANDQELFEEAHPLLKAATSTTREKVYRILLDHLRQGLAIRSSVLERAALDSLASKSHVHLRSPWGFSNDDPPRSASWLILRAPKRRNLRLQDEDLLTRGGARSALGRKLRSSELWDNNPDAKRLKLVDLDEIIVNLLEAAQTHGLVAEHPTPFECAGWQLNDQAIVFRLGTPTNGPSSSTNDYFSSLYYNLSRMMSAPNHPLFEFEAREHTAQVDSHRREIREMRFRFGKAEQAKLQSEEKELREMNESPRFLPLMFCSPTMELGVDIAALNVVHMRNVPPTPANYAQRSGRAGRSGQAALVLTYCAAQSPHDQHFFSDPREMVHGEVKAPLLDLANRDLVDSHLQAVWLSCVDMPLDPAISELVDLDDPERRLIDELQSAMEAPEVARTSIERIRGVLRLMESELQPADAPWFTDVNTYSESIVESALERFNTALGRWRNLLGAAEAQRDAARKAGDAYSALPAERRAAQGRERQATSQINLLLHGRENSSSDFYTYRYLATEGFLPGYNFPRLPLMAYLPATQDGRGKQAYLQRPRFLALSEFGPRSLVYHEGRAYRVTRAILPLSDRTDATASATLPTKSVRVCNECGAGHFNDQVSVCHACGMSLSTADIINHIYRIENVSTSPAERITANDEDRQRQGFDLQTTFEWAVRDSVPDVREIVVEASDPVARLLYGPGATITRLNKGLRRRADKSVLGFKIDPVHGYWAKSEDDSDGPDPSAPARQWIVPSVQDSKNALLFTPVNPGDGENTLPTLQHALLRGIEAVFQLEEGEVLAEPMPSRSKRNGFLFYEAAEGGAGVLARLVAEPKLIMEIARIALEVMHFEIPAALTLPADPSDLIEHNEKGCIAGCYRCLLSYFNQPDHEYIDRRDASAQTILLRMATAAISENKVETPPATVEDIIHDPWSIEARRRLLPPVDKLPLVIKDTTLPRVWREFYVVAVPSETKIELVSELEDLGFVVVKFSESKEWDTAFDQLAEVLGR